MVKKIKQRRPKVKLPIDPGLSHAERERQRAAQVQIIQKLAHTLVDLTCAECGGVFKVPMLLFPREAIHAEQAPDGGVQFVVRFTGAALCSKCAPPKGRLHIKREEKT